VSVIIPAYNRTGIIRDTIENIFQQTYGNIELIIVDDGSTDDTQSVLRSYGGRIQWATQENAGPASARNHGIRMAKGEIIAFQDSDDAWHPAKIERQVSLLERAGDSVPCCLCNTTLQFADGRVTTSFDHAWIHPPCDEGIWTNAAEVLTTRFIMFNQAVAIRRSVLAKTGGFDETIKYLEDYELPLRLSLEGPWGFIREPLVTWRQGSAHSWSQKAAEEETCTKECEIKLRQSVLQKVSEKEGVLALERLMGRNLRRVRRQLRALRLKRSASPGARLLGNALSRLGRLEKAIDHKMHAYPRMETAPIPNPVTCLSDSYAERSR
jgi:glycosyltransferase involved in cell wall biosynthesis